MPKRLVLSVGFELPGYSADTIPFKSRQSLMDADAIIFGPSFSEYLTKSVGGKQILSESRVASDIVHWRRELDTALRDGKTVFVFLSDPESTAYDTGKREFSGGARSRIENIFAENIHSYDFLPDPAVRSGVVAAHGTSIFASEDLGALATYWKLCSKYSKYQAYLPIAVLSKSLFSPSKAGKEYSVGGIKVYGNGRLVLLPTLFFPDSFSRKRRKGDDKEFEEFWTQAAMKFGETLKDCLVETAEVLKLKGALTPRPHWIAGQYIIAGELQHDVAITETEAQIELLNEKRVQLAAGKQQASILSRLLYEKGKPLEAAILTALKLMAFKAEPFRNADSEIDAVFVAPEGRFIGEAEGKDNKPIAIEKLDQLERNIREDYDREDISEYAIGVLFGNGFRLDPPNNRPAEFFTEKCLTTAKRSQTALIRTPDLFVVAKYLQENPNQDFARQCREAIIAGRGGDREISACAERLHGHLRARAVNG